MSMCLPSNIASKDSKMAYQSLFLLVGDYSGNVFRRTPWGMVNKTSIVRTACWLHHLSVLPSVPREALTMTAALWIESQLSSFDPVSLGC